MNNIDNLNLLKLGQDPVLILSGFTPAVTFTYTAGTSLTATDASSFTTGDAFKKTIVRIYDRFGNEATGIISAAAGNTGAISTSGLNPAQGLFVKVFVASQSGAQGEGEYGVRYKDLPASGSITYWNTKFNASENLNTGS